MIDTLIVILVDCFENVNFEEKNELVTKIDTKLPRMQQLGWYIIG